MGLGHAAAGSRLGSLSKYKLKDMQPLMALHLAAHFTVSYDDRAVKPLCRVSIGLCGGGNVMIVQGTHRQNWTRSSW